MTDSPDDRGAELRELFFETAQELVQALNEEALHLEKHPGDPEIVRGIRRTVHTLKGDSAACGLRELSELAHLFEDALSMDGAATQTALVEIALAAADIFSEMLLAYQHGGTMPQTSGLQTQIQEITERPAAPKSDERENKLLAAVDANWTEGEQQAIREAQSRGLAVYHVTARIDLHCAMPIAARQLLRNAVSSVGQVLAVRPDAKSPAVSKQVEFALASSEEPSAIIIRCQIPTISGEVRVARLAAIPFDSNAAPSASLKETHPAIIGMRAAPEATAHKAAAESSNAAVSENILRVEAGRIDAVLNLVGELIIGKSMLQQALNELSQQHPKDGVRGRFADAMSLQSRVLNDLQRSVMKIRMVPVEQLFRRFPRMVRDVARQCGREVELAVSGQETDLDKGILDSLAEPLTHLVRNAVSHGIETPEERRKSGKAAHGTIRLNAHHQGNQVVVEVSDDGRGMVTDKIRQRAIQLGFVSAEEAARLNEAETLDLIFRPGFSTADRVTEVSGRGVGMDVVQSVLHRLKATITVETRPGQGTTFRMKLPLTLAIIKALLFWVEQRLYAIPLSAVVEIARATEAQVHQVDNYEVLQLRDQVLPLVRLGLPAPKEGGGKAQKLFVLVSIVNERKFGLIVNGMEGEEELVIKALDDQTFSTDMVSGASILGDGRVVLILNLPALVEQFAKSRPTQTGVAGAGLLLSHTDRQRLAMSASGGQA